MTGHGAHGGSWQPRAFTADGEQAVDERLEHELEERVAAGGGRELVGLEVEPGEGLDGRLGAAPVVSRARSSSVAAARLRTRFWRRAARLGVTNAASPASSVLPVAPSVLSVPAAAASVAAAAMRGSMARRSSKR